MNPLIIKFGTGILAEPGGCAIDLAQIQRLASEISTLIKQGIPCIIVSSGAIAAGVHALNLEKRPNDVAGKQACAAVGQPMLMATYAKEFAYHEVTTAQLLLTHEDIYTKSRRHNAQATLNHLLTSRHVIPIINENDSVAVEELRLGDNDQLSAEVAVMMKARLLILLTSTDGLMTTLGGIPQQRIPLVTNLQDVLCHVTPEKGEHSTGGMATKLKAVEVATTAGIETIIADGRKPQQIEKALVGEDVGTRFIRPTGRIKV
ncbi:MAG: glutamate 5-kinase [Verrucomicrobia bacterium RIFCSPHIGHO2_12_FULL_41_10]|nr:MAG: glutamate 5-kinase [Verrucomicrobia bacterium RIFCSPHIGHO2_12_FULL_41_10]HLB34755.1 glutamate 5-kinase [Chthoniobacterales bacterium]